MELALVAALAQTPRGARLGFGVALAGLLVPAFVVAPPIPLTLLALAFLWAAIRAADFAFDRAPHGLLRRALHLVALVDTRALQRSAVRLDRAALLRFGVGLALAWAAAIAVTAAPATPAFVHYGLRWTAGIVLVLAAFEVSVATLELAVAAAGWITPPLHHSPHLARTVGEFWGRRWNRMMSDVLRVRAFLPLARRSPMVALSASFALSAAIHAYLIGFAGGTGAALCWAAFFLVQPLAIAAERRLGIRARPRWVGHAWTVGVLSLLAPLMLEPAFGVLGF